MLGAIACLFIGWIVSNARAKKGLPPMNKQELEADREKWVEDFYKQQAEVERLRSAIKRMLASETIGPAAQCVGEAALGSTHEPGMAAP